LSKVNEAQEAELAPLRKLLQRRAVGHPPLLADSKFKLMQSCYQAVREESKRLAAQAVALNESLFEACRQRDEAQAALAKFKAGGWGP
jgi:hypothetical protein